MKFVKRNTTKGSEGSNVTIKSYSNSSSSSSSSLTSHNIWGQPFDGTNDVTGDMQNVGSITATGNIQTDGDIIIKQLDTDGNEVEGGDLTMSVENADAQFSGKENYIFDGKIKGNSAEITNNIEVGGKGSFDSDLTVKGISKLKDVTSNNISNADTIRTKNLESYGNSTLNDVTSNNITNSDTIKTKNLEVTGSAHFFELIIDKVKAAGGAVLFTPANGFKVDIVESVTDGYKLYWQADDGSGNQADNMWKVNDQALCMSFNQAKEGTNHNISNKYYWSLVTAVSDTNQPVSIEEKKYHYIVISTVTKDGTVNPEIGDTIAMLGYRGTDDNKRQSAIYISAYSSLDKGLTAPLLAQYQGINDFNLESHRKSYFDANSAKFIGEFEVSNGQNIEDFINDKIKVVDDKYSSLSVTVDGIKTIVVNNTTTINNTNGQVAENKTNIANLSVKADSIESTVSSMSNGNGTNLFSFTNAIIDYNCMSAIQMNGFFTLALNQKIFRVKNLGTNGVTGDYVVSFDARVLNEIPNGTVVNVNFCDKKPIENNGDITLHNWFKHYVLHFKNVPSDFLKVDTWNGFIDFEPKVLDDTNQLYVANFMLERGNIPSANFSLSEADKNNFKSNNVFTSWHKAATVDIIDVSDLHNGTTTKAYRQIGLQEGQSYIDILSEYNLQKKFKVEPFKIYTLSFWAKTFKGIHRISNYLYPNIANAGLQNILYKDINGPGTQTAYTAGSDGYTSCELDNHWRKFYIHWQPHQVGAEYQCICGRLSEDKDENGDKVTVYIAEPKLEEGYICDENISNQDTYSSIKQTAESILAQVNDTYVKIGDGNITINGDTKVNGSLTLNDEKQGFLLIGNGGTTEISPKSIGSYNGFKDRTSNNIRTHYISDIRGELNTGNDTYAFFWSVSQNIGKYQKGDYIKLINYTNYVVTNIGTDIGKPYATFYINENGTQTKKIDIGTKTSVDIDYYTVVNDNSDIQITGQFKIYAPKYIWDTNRGIDTNLPNTPFISVTVDWMNEVPNKNSFMLIGYDGFGVNFGNNKTVYCGAEGFIASFGDTLLKITSDGIVERKNMASVEVINGSSSISSPLHYNLKDGVDTILCKRGYAIITLPREPYQGQSVKIYDKSPQEVWVNFQGYLVGSRSAYNTRTYVTKLALDSSLVRMYTFIGDTWFEEDMGQ